MRSILEGYTMPDTDGRRSDEYATAAPADEYQDGVSAGSLVRARRCWLALQATNALPLPQQFSFAFQCPTEQMAAGLMHFLRYTHYAAYVRMSYRKARPAGTPWRVTGTTNLRAYSLQALEHLFMHMRRAGSRYESLLMALKLVPMGQRRRRISA